MLYEKNMQINEITERRKKNSSFNLKFSTNLSVANAVRPLSLTDSDIYQYLFVNGQKRYLLESGNFSFGACALELLCFEYSWMTPPSMALYCLNLHVGDTITISKTFVWLTGDLHTQIIRRFQVEGVYLFLVCSFY